MKLDLDFKILADGILEARELDRVYQIFQMSDNCDAVVNGKHLISGNLYECLDACNQHAYDILYSRARSSPENETQR